MELRKYVGHAPLLMTGTATLIIDEKSRLLMMKRSDSGCWGPPGGGLELGEDLDTSARREVREETGLELNRLTLFGVFSGPDLFYRYPNGDEVYNIIIVYLTRGWSGEVRLSSEHTSWCWCTAKDIPDDLSPPIKPVIEQFKKSFI